MVPGDGRAGSGQPFWICADPLPHASHTHAAAHPHPNPHHNRHPNPNPIPNLTLPLPWVLRSQCRFVRSAAVWRSLRAASASSRAACARCSAASTRPARSASAFSRCRSRYYLFERQRRSVLAECAGQGLAAARRAHTACDGVDAARSDCRAVADCTGRTGRYCEASKLSSHSDMLLSAAV